MGHRVSFPEAFLRDPARLYTFRYSRPEKLADFQYFPPEVNSCTGARAPMHVLPFCLHSMGVVSLIFSGGGLDIGA